MPEALETNKLLLNSVDANLFAVAAKTLELYLSVNESEESIVTALANIVAGMNMGAALTNKNVACKNELTVCTLYAQTL